MPVSQLAWCQSVTRATFQPGSSWCGAQTAHHTDPSVLKEEGRERVADANARDRYCIHLLLIMQSFLCQQSSVPKLCLNTIVKTQMSKLLLVSFCTKPNSTDLHVGPVVVASGKEQTRPHYQKKNGPSQAHVITTQLSKIGKRSQNNIMTYCIDCKPLLLPITSRPQFSPVKCERIVYGAPTSHLSVSAARSSCHPPHTYHVSLAHLYHINLPHFCQLSWNPFTLLSGVNNLLR